MAFEPTAIVLTERIDALAAALLEEEPKAVSQPEPAVARVPLAA